MNSFRILLVLTLLGSVAMAADERPNILWITSEDNGPELGAYGDTYATTPHLDAFAARGMIYLNAWSNAPVCAPARTTIITGLYASSLGAQHMRSDVRLPEGFRMFPQYLRAAGYYCTNNVKEDYNVPKPGQVWDESSRKAHWKNRADGQPFFAVFNSTITHESRIRKRPYTPIHDPAKVSIPPYHPDDPEVRLDWAQYHDRMTEMDAIAGEQLRELEEAGLADDTIVFYYGDHGPGMPRGKRWTYSSGLRVPLIVHIPEKFKHLAPADYLPGAASDRLVSFVDLAPTVLSLTGIQPPNTFQGYAFMGQYEAPMQPYIFGFRDRMDERYDMTRAVRNDGYLYVRNYMPHRPYGQYLSYMFQTPTTQVWKNMFDAGTLNAVQQAFWKTKPAEELYDLRADPHQIDNLINDASLGQVAHELRRAQQSQVRRVRDVGFMPEAEMHERSQGSTPYELAHDASAYRMFDIMEVAELAASLRPEDTPRLIEELNSNDNSAIRYWAAMGLLAREESGVKAGESSLREALNDNSPSVRIIAAEALGRYGEVSDQEAVLEQLLNYANGEENGIYLAVLALNAIDYLDDNAAPIAGQVADLPTTVPGISNKFRNYIVRLVEKTLADLE